MGEVLAAAGWTTNAEMIADVAAMGWLDGRVLDGSYGEGSFWSTYRPEDLWTNDLFKPADHAYDMREPPDHFLAHFDAVVWDPPYKLGGTPSEQHQAMNERYGVGVARSKSEVTSLVKDGSYGSSLCVRSGGHLHVKVQNQINGGKFINQVDQVSNVILGNAGPKFVLVSIWYLVGHIRPQPPERRQLSPRNNVSQLMSFRRVDAGHVGATLF